MRGVFWSLAIAYVLALGVASAAEEEPRGIAPGRTAGRFMAKDFQVVICNKSSYQIGVAASYVPVGESDFFGEGWWIVERGTCANVFKTRNVNFYLRGEQNGGTRYWAGGFYQCVVYPGPFRFRYYDGQTTCSGGQESVPFQPLTYTGPLGGTYTWNLYD